MLNLKKQLVRKNKNNYKNISELLNYFFNKIKIKNYPYLNLIYILFFKI